jgi:hypothetical protein
VYLDEGGRYMPRPNRNIAVYDEGGPNIDDELWPLDHWSDELIATGDARLIEFLSNPLVLGSICGLDRVQDYIDDGRLYYLAAHLGYKAHLKAWDVLIDGEVLPRLFPDWYASADAPYPPSRRAIAAAQRKLMGLVRKTKTPKLKVQ